MCFCLLPATGFKFEFCFAREPGSLRIFCKLIEFSLNSLNIKDLTCGIGFIQQI